MFCEAVIQLFSGKVPSTEEAIGIAHNAAWEMAPEPGRVILSAVLYVIADLKSDLSTIEMIGNIIHQIIAEEGVLVFGVAFCDKKGIRFLLSTTEREDFVSKTQ